MEELERLRAALGEEHGDLLAALEQAIGRLQATAEQAAALEAAAGETATLRAELAAARAAQQATDERAAALAEDVAAAVAKYRALLVAANPDVPARLVQGATIEEVDASLAAAKALTAEIRRQIIAEQAAIVPTGAGGRTPIDRTALSPFEKIRQGLAER